MLSIKSPNDDTLQVKIDDSDEWRKLKCEKHVLS